MATPRSTPLIPRGLCGKPHAAITTFDYSKVAVVFSLLRESLSSITQPEIEPLAILANDRVCRAATTR